jgi:hypothetical protein
VYEAAPAEAAQLTAKFPVTEFAGTVMEAGAGGGRSTTQPLPPAVHPLLPEALVARTR